MPQYFLTWIAMLDKLTIEHFAEVFSPVLQLQKTTRAEVRLQELRWYVALVRPLISTFRFKVSFVVCVGYS